MAVERVNVSLRNFARGFYLRQPWADYSKGFKMPEKLGGRFQKNRGVVAGVMDDT
jgi:hypothetical protein